MVSFWLIKSEFLFAIYPPRSFTFYWFFGRFFVARNITDCDMDFFYFRSVPSHISIFIKIRLTNGECMCVMYGAHAPTTSNRNEAEK